MDNDTTETPATATPGGDFLLDLNFVPVWARKAPGDNPYRAAGDREPAAGASREREDRFGGRDRPPRRPGGPRPDRPPRPGGPRRPDERPAVRRSAAPAPAAPVAPPPPLEIVFLPERRHLSAVVRQVRAARRAFPLAELAQFILRQPDGYQARIELRSAEPGRPPGKLAQCRICHSVFLREDEALEHAVQQHLDRYFEEQTVQEEAPTGQFFGVARCRLSGELLGPPNHHAYGERLQELQATRFSHLTLDEYRAQVETVRDPALVEQWKEQYRTRRVLRRRDTPDAPPLTRAEALAALRAEKAAELVQSLPRALAPAAAARALADGAVKRAIREAWNREDRFPLQIMTALRPAFRHMGLHLFKAGDNHTFVTAIAPAALHAEFALPAIRQALDFLAAHPGATRAELLAGLLPGQDERGDAARELATHLRWLVDKGHVIEFFNGALAVPRRDHPRRPAAKNA